MTWTAYRLVFKLKSPMHIGCGKVGNVQRTRPYVTGRVFWGALTLRLTRDAASGSATDSHQYKVFGDQVNSHLAFTYFYPATKQNGDYQIQWSWGEEENLFRRRFLSSYTSTALVYPQQAADEGLLHEVEFLSPRTLDNGEQVYLLGYVFEKEDCTLKWRDACQHLQFGGERGYGWGDVQCIEIKPLDHPNTLFKGQAIFDGSEDRPIIQAERLLAHASSTGITATGEIEPLVGREWKVSHQAGQSVEQFCPDLCWAPGSTVKRSQNFEIQTFGIWHLPSSSS